MMDIQAYATAYKRVADLNLFKMGKLTKKTAEAGIPPRAKNIIKDCIINKWIGLSTVFKKKGNNKDNTEAPNNLNVRIFSGNINLLSVV